MALEGKRILITGGAGFIATTLARELVDDNEIVAVDNLHRDALTGTSSPTIRTSRSHQGDVLDGEAAEGARARRRPTSSTARRSPASTRCSRARCATMRVNVIGTYNALEAALATLGHARAVRRLLDERGLRHARLQRQRGPGLDDRLGRRGPLDLRGLQARGRAHGARLPRRAQLPTVTVHPFNVFGPGQIGGGAIRAFIEAALGGRDLTVHGDGSQIRAWCYVTDMVSGVLACLERPEAVGQAFNIGNPRSSVTIYDLAQRIKRLTGCAGEIVFAPLGYVDVELRIPNVEKARELLGWEPQVELDDGLAQDDRVVPGES